MRAEVVYAKTRQGREEIRARACGLDSRHRTLLILIDGRRSVAELAGQLGPANNELDAMLIRLVALGLIHAGQAPASTLPAQAPADDWTVRRGRASRLLQELLGPDANRLALRLEGLEQAEELTPLLERCRELLRAARGETVARRFAEALGIEG